MDQIKAMRLFTRVAELASFRKAAEQLDTPLATASNAIHALEQQVGVRLLQRTTRKVTLTTEGALYYERCSKLLAELDDIAALFAANQAKPKGVVRIDLPERLARLAVIPQLPGFFDQFPDIQLRLSATDRFVDLIGEAVDCVLRVGPLADSTLIAKSLGTLEQINCGAKTYLDQHGRPQRLADLAAHYAVNFFSSRTGRDLGWEYVEQGEVRTLKMQSRISVSSSDAYLACCEAGLGLIQTPRLGIAAQLADDRLEQVLTDYPPPALPVSIIYPSSRSLSPRVRVFIDWLAAMLQL